MNCEQARRLLHGFIDREVGLESSLGIESHLEACGACRALHDELAAAAREAKEHMPYHAAPARLKAQIQAGLPAAPRVLARRALLAGAVAAIALAGGWLGTRHLTAPASRAVEQVVYHLSTSENARVALRNLANHIEASPGARVVVVAHNNGVEFLLAGAKDREGVAFQPEVARLRSRGVDFRICGNTLALRGIAAAKVIPEAVLVPSGIAEISRLQSREGFAYLRL